MKTVEDVALDLAMARRVGFDDDRSKRIGASEIGQCGRKVMLGKFGIVQDDGNLPTSGFAVRGDVMEDHWTAPLMRAWIKEHGGELLYSGQANQTTLKGTKIPLSATPDGLAVRVSRKVLARYGVPDIGPRKELVLELKSLDPRVGQHKLPKPAHVPQTITQMGMIRRSKELKHAPEWGAVVYVDASDWFKVQVFPVKWEEKKFDALVKRANKLLSVSDPNQIAPEGKIAGGNECTECPWARQCLGFMPWLADEDPRQLKSKDIAEIEKVALRLHQAKEAVEKAKQVERDREADLYGVMATKKRRFVMGKSFTVSAKETSGQNRYDIAALVAALKKKGGDPEKCRKMTKPGASMTVEPR